MDLEFETQPDRRGPGRCVRAILNLIKIAKRVCVCVGDTVREDEDERKTLEASVRAV